MGSCNECYLDIEGIENSLFNGGDVGVKNIELQIFKCSYGFKKLARSPPREDLYHCIKSKELDFNIS